MTTTDIEVPLREVFPLFQCSVCHGVPMFPPVHSCSRGHNVCFCCMDLVNNQCNECKEPLSVRNTFLEEFLASTTFAELMNSTGSGEMTVGTAASQTMENIVTDECAAQLLVSGRTVSCPFPCHAMVTASGLYRHFEFGHPEVLLGMLCKNRPFNVVIPGELMTECTGVSRCLYILVVDVADDNNEDRLTALNSMSAAELLSITESMSNMLRRQKYLAMLSVRPLSTCKGLAAWVTALYDFSPVKYTLRYNNGPNCTSYHGRPKSLLSFDDPLSDCLILSSAPTSYLDLELTLIFHLDLPFPRTVDQPEKEHTGPWELLY